MILRTFFIVCALASLSSGTVAAGEEYLATPAIDRGIYRDGQVRRTSRTVGPWSVICDEVVRLRQRFCSLETFGRDAAGVARVGLTVSTADDGKPAALLRLPFGVLLRRGVEVSVTPVALGHPSRGRATPAEGPTRLRVVQCDSSACLTVWRLTALQLAALNEAGAIKFRYYAPASYPIGLDLESSVALIEATVDCGGFADAVRATLQ